MLTFLNKNMYSDLKYELRIKLDNYMNASFEESPEMTSRMIKGESLISHADKEYIALAVSVEKVLTYGNQSMKNRWKIKKLIREIHMAFNRIIGHYSWLNENFPYLRYDELKNNEILRHHAILSS